MFEIRGAPSLSAPAGAGGGRAADRPASTVDAAGFADVDDAVGPADLDDAVDDVGVDLVSSAGECAGRLAAMAPGGALAEVVERVMRHVLSPAAVRPRGSDEDVEAFGGGPCTPGPDGWMQSFFDPVRAAAPDDGLLDAMAGGVLDPGERALLEAAGAGRVAGGGAAAGAQIGRAHV